MTETPAPIAGRVAIAGVFVFIAGCMGVMAMVIEIFGPRTKDFALEKISQ